MTGDYGGWAVVTGASSGIGEEFARRLAERRHPVALVARRGDRLAALAAEIRAKHGVETREILADLADPAGPAQVAAAMADAEVGFLVNNAGFGWSGRFVDADPAHDAAMIRLNCGAVTELTHAFLPAMLRRGRGAIVIVASLAGHQPTPWFAVYGATKAFDLMLAEALWSETRGTGVDVLALAPGSTKTEFSDVAHAKRPPRGLDVGPVVDAAFRALGRRPSVVPGWKDKLAAFAHRFVPRGFAAETTGRVLAADLLKTTPDELRRRGPPR